MTLTILDDGILKGISRHIRIALVGAHGVGKTTLAVFLHNRYGLSLINEVVCIGYPIGDIEKMTDAEKTLEIPWTCLTRQLDMEDKAERTGYIVDGSTLDYLIYSMTKTPSLADSDMRKICIDHMSHYSHIFYIPIEFDGRHLDETFQHIVDTHMVGLLRNNNIPYYTISGSLMDRVSSIDNILNETHFSEERQHEYVRKKASNPDGKIKLKLPYVQARRWVSHRSATENMARRKASDFYPAAETAKSIKNAYSMGYSIHSLAKLHKTSWERISQVVRGGYDAYHE